MHLFRIKKQRYVRYYGILPRKHKVGIFFLRHHCNAFYFLIFSPKRLTGFIGTCSKHGNGTSLICNNRILCGGGKWALLSLLHKLHWSGLNIIFFFTNSILCNYYESMCSSVEAFKLLSQPIIHHWLGAYSWRAYQGPSVKKKISMV